jgi:ankyrin repeat protein
MLSRNKMQEMQSKKPIPARFLCPITKQIMLDPVFAADGRTYEREAIETWLEKNNTSPITNAVLENKKLIDNFDKLSDIAEYLDKRPELYEGDDLYLPKAAISDVVAAIKQQQLSVVDRFITKDRRLLTRRLENNYSAWHLACQYGSSEITALLLRKLSKEQIIIINQDAPTGFKPSHLNTLLEQAVTQVDLSQASLLLSLGAELEQPELQTGNSLLQRCILQGSKAAVIWLLDNKANLEHSNKDANTPLLLAISHKHGEIAALLLSHGANVKHSNHAQQNAVSLAALNNNPAILQLLIDEQQAKLPPLHLALDLKDQQLLKLLLTKNSNIEVLDDKQSTPLYRAISNDDVVATELLLAHGANPVATCFNKTTPLHRAASNGNLAIVKLLLSSKPDLNLDVADLDGNTALHVAAKLAKDQIIQELLLAKANHKARNKQWQTPAKLAVKCGNVETALSIEQTMRGIKLDKLKRLEKIDDIVILQQKISQLEQEKLVAEQERKAAGQERAAHLARISQLENTLAMKAEAKQARIEAARAEAARAEAARAEAARAEAARAEAARAEAARAEAARAEAARAEAARAEAARAEAARAEETRKIVASELAKFLKYVVEGEQDQAEEMLRQRPELALYPGNVTDLSGRTFNNITGFQYAVWALDWDMWKMFLRDYLPTDKAREQVQGLETGSWVAQHGKSASWQNLIDALDEFIKLCNKSKWDQATKQWNGAVGNAQQQLPVHVVNQYCHPTRSFSPCPNFNDQTQLPRSRKTDEGDWFTCEYNGGKLGKNCFALARGAHEGCVGWDNGRRTALEDRTVCVTYLNHKTQLRDQLLSDLTSTSYCNKPGL